MIKSESNGGFTLIEALILLGIIVILAAIAIPDILPELFD